MDHCAGGTFTGFVFKSGLVGAWGCTWSPKSHSENCLIAAKWTQPYFLVVYWSLRTSLAPASENYNVVGLSYRGRKKYNNWNVWIHWERKPWISSNRAQKSPDLCQKTREQGIPGIWIRAWFPRKKWGNCHIFNNWISIAPYSSILGSLKCLQWEMRSEAVPAGERNGIYTSGGCQEGWGTNTSLQCPSLHTRGCSWARTCQSTAQALGLLIGKSKIINHILGRRKEGLVAEPESEQHCQVTYLKKEVLSWQMCICTESLQSAFQEKFNFYIIETGGFPWT